MPVRARAGQGATQGKARGKRRQAPWWGEVRGVPEPWVPADPAGVCTQYTPSTPATPVSPKTRGAGGGEAVRRSRRG